MNEIITPVAPSGAYGRFAANILDGIYLGLVGIPLFIVYQLLTSGSLSFNREVVDGFKNNIFIQIIAIAGFFLYFLWFNVNKGATPGKSSYKLTIAKYGTTEKMGYGRALVRELTKLIDYVPIIGTMYFLINAIIILFSKQKGTLYDLIAGTQVVKR